MTTVEELRAKRVLRVGYLPAVHLALPVKDGGLLSAWGTTRFVAPAFITLQRSKSGLACTSCACRYSRPAPKETDDDLPMRPPVADERPRKKRAARNSGLAMNVVVSVVLLRAKTKLINWNAHCVIWKSAKT